jgi:lipoprotein NlpI
MDEVATVRSEWQRLTRLLATEAQNPTVYIQRGMASFKLGDIAAAIDDFDQAEHLQPALTPWLWQRGLAYYYAGRFLDGVTQFETDLHVNQHDVEETVWRYLCQAQVQGAPAARAALLPVQRDRRPVMAWVYRLFAGDCTVETLLDSQQTSGRTARFYSQLYAGLYYEAAGEPARASHHMTQAAAMQVWEDYMGWVARVHCGCRGWDIHLSI